jgi:hypothetical protein
MANNDEEDEENYLPPPHLEKSSNKRAASGSHGPSRNVRINFGGGKSTKKNDPSSSRAREVSILHNQHQNFQY